MSKDTRWVAEIFNYHIFNLGIYANAHMEVSTIQFWNVCMLMRHLEKAAHDCGSGLDSRGPQQRCLPSNSTQGLVDECAHRNIYNDNSIQMNLLHAFS